ncbi:MAG TPA: putative porin [Pyrinomonadaceae bacterium]
MPKKSGSTIARAALIVLLAGLLLTLSVVAQAQPIQQLATADGPETAHSATPKDTDSAAKKPLTVEEKLNLLQQLIEQQNARLNQLQQTVEQQQETIRLLAGQVVPTTSAASTTTAMRVEPEPVPQQTPSVEDRLKKVESTVSALGNIRFSGDIRLRSESLFGNSNNLASGANPLALGNALSSRHRMRLRARLAVRGSISEEFDWGLRFASGSFPDTISTNQTFTDFFNRKPFSLDQAFIIYKPKKLPGLRLQGGKFELPWTATEMTIDNDLMVEGFNESYSRTSKDSVLRDITFVAWQLPMLERNSAFVRNADGTINIAESRRGGRDLAMFGAQLRTRFEPTSKIALNLSIADLYFSGTQFISPVQVFGSLLQLPITIALPGGGIATSQVSIPRDLLVAGNGNLGITTASNNATNRDGRLSSGFNLIDMIARLELKHSERFPVTMIANFVKNTQVHDVIAAGPGGTEIVIPNKEDQGFWGEIQVGQTRAKGDMQFGYTFMRIEKDAVLTPFNWSDVTQQSDMRGHRFVFSYAADPRVVFTVIGIVTQRASGLLGPFVATPIGSLNRDTTRLQVDTTLRF